MDLILLLAFIIGEFRLSILRKEAEWFEIYNFSELLKLIFHTAG